MSDLASNFFYISGMVISIYIYSLIIGIISTLLIRLTSQFRWIVLIVCSLGIIIHEISHLLLALIFRHKIINIDLVSSNGDQLSGFVETSYETRSKYQKVGVFFVSVAPAIIPPILLLMVIFAYNPTALIPLSQLSDKNTMLILQYITNNKNSIATLITFTVLMIPMSSLSLKDTINSLSVIFPVLMIAFLFASLMTLFEVAVYPWFSTLTYIFLIIITTYGSIVIFILAFMSFFKGIKYILR